MPKFICIVCGVHYAETEGAPSHCPICEDERQWVHHEGQKWTTLEELRLTHRNQIELLESNLFCIRTEPHFAIGQQGYLVQSSGGNILWDCISLIDEKTVEALNSLGGVSAIAISHPHFYSSMVEWSKAFNNAPIYLHAADRAFAMDKSPAIVFWEGETHQLGEGLVIVRCGGHFDGSSALYWANGAGGRGILLASDTIMVAFDNRYVSFMYSYPNLIPLCASKIRGILKAVEPFAFDRIYSGWRDHVCKTNAKQAISLSADRYISRMLS